MPLNELQKRTLLVLIKASIDDLLEPGAVPSADYLLKCIAPLQTANGQTWKVLAAQPRLFGWIAEKNHPMNFTVPPVVQKDWATIADHLKEKKVMAPADETKFADQLKRMSLMPLYNPHYIADVFSFETQLSREQPSLKRDSIVHLVRLREFYLGMSPINLDHLSPKPVAADMPAFVAGYVNERLGTYKTRVDAIASTEEQVNALTESLAKDERELSELEMARMKHVQLVHEKNSMDKHDKLEDQLAGMRFEKMLLEAKVKLCAKLQQIAELKLQLSTLGRVNTTVVIQQSFGGGGLSVSLGDSKSSKALAKALSSTASDENDTKVIDILRLYQRGMDLNLKAATDPTGKWRKEAFSCFSQAAEQGHVGATAQLGMFYLNGYNLVKIDVPRARDLFMRAARGGDKEAASRLAYLFALEGKFSDPTKVQRAITLWQLTSERAFSQINIGAAASIGWGQIKKDEKEAAKWFKNCVPVLEKDSAKGNAEAQTTLSFCYHNGYGVAKDPKLGLEWYAKAAGQGHAYAQYHFAECFRRGVGTGQPDPKKAAEILLLPVKQGLPVACSRLAEMTWNGQGVAKDLKRAMELYREAADQGDPHAIAELDKLSSALKS